VKPSNLSRRTFLIAGTTAATVAWLTRPGTEPAASAASVAPIAAAVERPHRTLLGVL